MSRTAWTPVTGTIGLLALGVILLVIAWPASLLVYPRHVPGYFYRLQARFTVKETGERIDFDYVVACNIPVPRWGDGRPSQLRGMNPRMMVKTTADRHAVMLKTLDECNGLTSADGSIPPDVLPMAIWFDSVDVLSHGLAYVSEDAFDSPKGKLAFGGARVDAATRADWEAWRKRSADAYVQRGALPGPWGYSYEDDQGPGNPDQGKYAGICAGYRRIEIPAIIAENVATLWPADKPRFWTVRSEDDGKLRTFFNDARPTQPPVYGNWLARFGSPSDGSQYGMPLRSGRSVSRPPHSVPDRWSSDFYPLLTPPIRSADPFEVDTTKPPPETQILKLDPSDEALNGFAACTTLKDWTALHLPASGDRINQIEQQFIIDGDVVRKVLGHRFRAATPTFVLDQVRHLLVYYHVSL